MKIGIDARTVGKGATGDEVYTRNLLSHLSSTDDEYIIFTDSREKADLLANVHLPAGSRIIVIMPASKLLWTQIFLPIWCLRLGIDVLHVQYICPLALPRRTRLVTTIHDISWRFFPLLVRRKDRFALNALIRPALMRADLVITDTVFSRDAIMAEYPHIDPHKIKVVYLGGGLIEACDPTGELVVIRGLVGSSPYFLYVGSLQPRKNLPFLLRCFATIRKARPEIKLVIAGARGYNFDAGIDQVVEQFALSGSVVFTGFIDEVTKVALLQRAISLVFPSLFEGFGIPILEAFSAGCPVIAANNSCLPEIIDGNGLLIDPHNESDMTEKMMTLIVDYEGNQNIRNRLIGQARKRMRYFSWESMTLEMQKIYLQAYRM